MLETVIKQDIFPHLLFCRRIRLQIICKTSGREEELVEESIENSVEEKSISWLQIEDLAEERNWADDFTRFLCFTPCKACVRYREVIFVLHSHGHNCCFSGRD